MITPVHWMKRKAPINVLPREISPDAIMRDVTHAMEIAHNYLALLPDQNPIWLKGKVVMEIGPGPHFGVPLLLTSMGARVIVADRFPPPWQPDYHPLFYTLLQEMAAKEFPDGDPSILARVAAGERSLQGMLMVLPTPLERIPLSIRGRCDFVFSNAVLEHLYHPRRAIRRMAIATQLGGLGFHQIDFRDHRDFSRPLEYLLLSRFRFQRIFHYNHGECGNRLRPNEFSQIFKECGYQIEHFQPNLLASEEYLHDFYIRLQAAKSSAYRNLVEPELKILGGCFHLRREK